MRQVGFLQGGVFRWGCMPGVGKGQVLKGRLGSPCTVQVATADLNVVPEENCNSASTPF